MIYRHNYDGKCWWCGDKANSREHKFKASDLRRLYGEGPYGKSIVRGQKGKLHVVQGPKSDQAKFPAVICARCNNERSQIMDFAYDRFMDYVTANEAELINDKVLDFEKIYGAEWEREILRLSGYFLKFLGCQLASSNIKVSDGMVDFLNGTAKRSHVMIVLVLRLDLVAFMERCRKDGIQEGGLWIGDGIAQESRSTGQLSEYRLDFSYRWLEIGMLYDEGLSDFEDDLMFKWIQLKTRYNLSPDYILNDLKPVGKKDVND